MSPRGLTPLAALQAATISAAKFLGREEELGSIEVGKLADLVLLDADPLVEIRNTTNIWGVVSNGTYYDRTMLDEILKTARTHADDNSE